MNTTDEQARDEERTAAKLVAARRVLVTGFTAAPVETAALACDLAEALGAAVDPGDIGCGQVAGPTITRIGAVTADPGELRDRADLVVFWFCPPAQAAAFRAAYVTPAIATGRTRRVLTVGPTAAAPEGHVAVPRDDAFDLTRLLHAAAAGIACPAPAPLAAACDTLRTALDDAGCVAFVTCHDDPTGLEPWSLAGLVRALAHAKPAFQLPLGHGGAGAAICTWRFGAAGAIAQADRNGAAFLPAECDALRLVSRGEVDGIVTAGPLPAAVEAAIAARGDAITVIRADEHSLSRLLAAVRTQAAVGGRP